MFRIGHVNIGYPPARGLGGPTRVVANYATEQARRGHRVDVVCTNLHGKRSAIYPETHHATLDGVRVHYLRTYVLSFWPGTLGPLWTPELVPLLQGLLPDLDIVHLHGVRDSLSFLTAFYAYRTGIPYVVQPHGELPRLRYGSLKALYDLLFARGMMQRTSALLALSAREAAECCQMVTNKSVRVERVTNGINLSSFWPLPERGWLRKQIGIGQEKPLVLFLGRLNWVKGVDLLLQAFARCKTDALLILVGPDEGEQGKLEQMAVDLGISKRAFFIGPLSPDDVMKAYVDADVFAITSRKELFPFTVVEACIAGVPIVMTNVCEISDLINERAGIVVPAEKQAIADAIDRLLQDTRLRKQLSEEAQALARQEFSITSVVDRLDVVYARVIDVRRRGTY